MKAAGTQEKLLLQEMQGVCRWDEEGEGFCHLHEPGSMWESSSSDSHSSRDWPAARESPAEVLLLRSPWAEWLNCCLTGPGVWEREPRKKDNVRIGRLGENDAASGRMYVCMYQRKVESKRGLVSGNYASLLSFPLSSSCSHQRCFIEVLLNYCWFGRRQCNIFITRDIFSVISVMSVTI